MTKTRSIQFRLTREEYDRIKNNARSKGFTFLSNYLRYVALEQDLVLHQRIQEIHHQLLGPEKPKRLRKNQQAMPFL